MAPGELLCPEFTSCVFSESLVVLLVTVLVRVVVTVTSFAVATVEVSVTK